MSVAGNIYAACMTDTTGCTDLRQQPSRDGLRGSRGPRYQVSPEGENDLNLIKVINPLARLISAYPFMRRITNGLIRKLMLMLLSPHRWCAAGPRLRGAAPPWEGKGRGTIPFEKKMEQQ